MALVPFLNYIEFQGDTIGFGSFEMEFHWISDIFKHFFIGIATGFGFERHRIWFGHFSTFLKSSNIGIASGWHFESFGYFSDIFFIIFKMAPLFKKHSLFIRLGFEILKGFQFNFRHFPPFHKVFMGFQKMQLPTESGSISNISRGISSQGRPQSWLFWFFIDFFTGFYRVLLLRYGLARVWMGFWSAVPCLYVFFYWWPFDYS